MSKPKPDLGEALAQHIVDQPFSAVQSALRILGWPLRFELVEVAEESAPATDGEPVPLALFEENARRHQGAIARVDELLAVIERRERELKAVGEAQQKADQERDGAYRERAHLVALLAAMTDHAVIAPALDVEEPGWQIVYLQLGGHQASWHISPRDADLFQHVERVDVKDPRARWDGHTTEAKYQRIAAWTADLAERCGPACAEQHTEIGRCVIARNR